MDNTQPVPPPRGHVRNKSATKSTRPRSSTKGPLDADDAPLAPLSQTATSLANRTPSRYLPRRPSPSPLPQSPTSPLALSGGSSNIGHSPDSNLGGAPRPPVTVAASSAAKKDFSFLLRPEIYHPLPLTSVPAPFRTSKWQPDPETTPLQDLLEAGHFRAAAVAAAQQLTGIAGAGAGAGARAGVGPAPAIDPTDYKRIFDLLYTRLVCLLLIDATSLAAQEGKALEDLNSAFYRVDGEHEFGEHLVPWHLRVLSVRLQALGFGDPRRAIMGYYDLAREARARLARARATHDHSTSERWREHLAELGLQVAGALIEMDDLAGAAAHLATLRGCGGDGGNSSHRLAVAQALLWLHVGDVDAARAVVKETRGDDGDDGNDGNGDGNIVRVVAALCDMADDRYEEAAAHWRELRDDAPDDEMIGVNLAVCLLYIGKMDEGRIVLEELVDAGYTSHTLLFNLSTMYELCTDRSKSRKQQLAQRVAALKPSAAACWERTNADFKL